VPATPAPASDGASSGERASSLVEWLRRRDDHALARLLRLRPDLALPAPPDIAALAGRVAVRSSTQRAIDALDAHVLRALENLVLAAGNGDAVTDPAPDGLDELFDRALVWGDADLVHVVPTVREALGPYPAGLGRPAAALFPLVPDVQLVPVLRALGIPPTGQPRAGAAVAERFADAGWVPAQLADLDADEREVVERLASGPPIGTVRPYRPPLDPGGTGGADAAHRLIARGLLVPIDTQRVELPRELGRALRATSAPASHAGPPAMQLVEREAAELDRLGTTAVLDTLRLVDSLADLWTANPPTTLRSGGLGVRDMRRTAKDLGLDEATAPVIIETAYAAGLLNVTNGVEPSFLPTADYDTWRERSTAARWLPLASAWVAMTRQPSLVNQRGDRDRVISALGPDVERGTMPALRRQVLDLLTGLPPGAAPASREEVLAVLEWHQPRRARSQRPLAEAVLREAGLLGVTAAGGLTGYSRTLLAGSQTAAEHALAQALPDPVDHFLVQPDLTLVVPGPPEPSLATELALVADLESTGGASVYRVTASSVRRALDHGRSGEQLVDFVQSRSRTPIPQALTYLIEDAARRHGVLRSGAASGYLRCDDTALLARAVSDRATAELHLRLLAPTVAVTDVAVVRVLDVLRGAGYAPAAESPDGELVMLGADPLRAPVRPPARAIVARAAVQSDAQVGELVRRMRASDAAPVPDPRVTAVAGQIAGVTSAATMELLRRAIREDRRIDFGCAEADGRITAHTVRPISLAAGMIRGYERGRAGLVAYPVHRLTWIRLVEHDADDDGDDDADDATAADDDILGGRDGA
jgi:hypothetical protein